MGTELRVVMDLDKLKTLAVAATPLQGESVRRVRYEHGGGRLYIDEASTRQLVLDTFDEANREYYYATPPHVVLALIARVEQAEAELAALKAERTWQPMETMPRDGKPFMVWWGRSEERSGPAYIDTMASHDEYDQIIEFGELPATHWMRPAAPTGAER